MFPVTSTGTKVILAWWPPPGTGHRVADQNAWYAMWDAVNAAYSGTMSVRYEPINEPADYRQLLGEGADGVEFSDRTRTASSFVHLFTTRCGELEKQLSRLRKKIPDTGTIWVSWPKRASGVPTDVTEDIILAIALSHGFVDVKVCAFEETRSGLKLMVRRANRI